MDRKTPFATLRDVSRLPRKHKKKARKKRFKKAFVNGVFLKRYCSIGVDIKEFSYRAETKENGSLLDSTRRLPKQPDLSSGWTSAFQGPTPSDQGQDIDGPVPQCGRTNPGNDTGVGAIQKGVVGRDDLHFLYATCH